MEIPAASHLLKVTLNTFHDTSVETDVPSAVSNVTSYTNEGVANDLAGFQ